MRWLRFRRRKHSPQPSEDARAALLHARRQLADTNKIAERVDEVAAQLAEIGRRNHFADSIRQVMRGGA